MTETISLRRSPRFAFFMIDNAIIDSYAATVEPSVLVVFLALSRHASNDEQTSRVSLATIAAKLGMSRTTVIRAIDRLETDGLLAVERVKDERGLAACNVYTVIGIPPTASASVAPGGGTTVAPRGSTTVVPGGSTTVVPSKDSGEKDSLSSLLPPSSGEREERDAPPPKSTEPPLKIVKARPPDPYFDTMAELLGVDPKLASPGELSRLGKNVRRYKAFTTPEEIRMRAANYRREWPKMTFSFESLESNWQKFAASPYAPGGAKSDYRADGTLKPVF